jgi:hypothetical protein
MQDGAGNQAEGKEVIEIPVIQNTAAWHRQRAGIPTGSAAKHLITPTGKPASGEAVEKYMYQLIYERIAENPIVSFQSFWMQRGHEEEERAIRLYEFSRDVQTEPCGFILNDSRTAGASPDAKVVGKKRGLECKAPKPENHLMYLMKSGHAWKEHYPQLQFELMITGWEEMDLYSFHPELPPAIVLTERNPGYIETLENIVGEFNIKLEAKYAELVEMGLAQAQWRKSEQMPKPHPISQASIIDAMKDALISTQKGQS